MLAVEVEDRAPALADALVGAGMRAVVDGRTVLVDLSDDRPWDAVRDAAADLGLPLVRIEQRRHGLEELFR
jgi:ABC-2 type transport system ATP-binding protein